MDSGTITLESLVLPAHARVALRAAETPGEYRISVEAEELALRVGVHGLLDVQLSPGTAQRLDFASPHTVVAIPQGDILSLSVTPRDSTSRFVAPGLEVTQLSLSRVDQVMDEATMIVRRQPTIVSGSVYFEELGSERTLRTGDLLQFDDIEGEIRLLRLSGSLITLTFHGRVSGMALGAGKYSRSLMPTWLERLKASRSLTLLWGAMVYVLGLVAGLVKWFGKAGHDPFAR
jgi:hypothetical protein